MQPEPEKIEARIALTYRNDPTPALEARSLVSLFVIEHQMGLEDFWCGTAEMPLSSQELAGWLGGTEDERTLELAFQFEDGRQGTAILLSAQEIGNIKYCRFAGLTRLSEQG